MKNENQNLSRRSFLAASATAVVTPVFLSGGFSPANVEAAPVLSALQSSDIFDVGFTEFPSSAEVGGNPAPAETTLDRAKRLFRDLAFRNQIQEHDASADFRGSVMPATEIQGDAEFLTKGVKVSLLGMYTNRRQWRNNDSGVLKMNIKFDEIVSCGGCTKVSSTSIGSTFTALPNNLVPEYSNSQIIDKIKITDAKNLRMSFDLVDIADEADRAAIKKALDVTNKFAESGGNVISLVPGAAVGLVVLEAASKIIDAFVDKPSNKVLWSSKDSSNRDRDLIFLTGGSPTDYKLKRGIYFIAGFGAGSSLPAWRNFQLRASDRDNAGKKVYLYGISKNRRKLLPADFTYITLAVDYAS